MDDDRLIIFTGPSPRGWHRLQTFLECPQRYAWGELVGIGGVNENAPPLAKGTLVHLGLAQHYARMRETQQGREPDLYYNPTEAIDIMVEAKPHWHEFGELAKTVVEAYKERWKNERLNVIAVEEMLEANIGGYRFTGRMDLVYEDSQGRVWIMDHKTTGHLSNKQKKFYSVSGQILGYRWLGHITYGDRFAGLRLNMIQHGGDFKFQRLDVEAAPRMYSRWPQTVVDAEEGIQRLMDSGRAPDEWPMASSELVCYHRYGPCQYVEQCKWGQANGPEK